MKQYALHPCKVYSKTDDDIHQISADQLASLYGVDRNHYVIWENDSHGRIRDAFIHLYPDPTGRYKLPKRDGWGLGKQLVYWTIAFRHPLRPVSSWSDSFDIAVVQAQSGLWYLERTTNDATRRSARWCHTPESNIDVMRETYELKYEGANDVSVIAGVPRRVQVIIKRYYWLFNDPLAWRRWRGGISKRFEMPWDLK